LDRLRILAFAAALAAVVAVSTAAPARADDAETMAVARELFAVTFDRAGLEINTQAVAHTWPSLENALRAKNPDLDAAKSAELQQQFTRIRMEKMRALMKDAPAIYARHFSVDEMRQIIAFYRTPAGAHLIQAAPSIVGEIFAIALPAMPTIVAETYEDFLKVARARGYVK
jgi:hypothetical protein